MKSDSGICADASLFFSFFFSLLFSSGYYVYIESSSPRKQGDKAWLVSSPFLATNAGDCTVSSTAHVPTSLFVFDISSQWNADTKVKVSFAGNPQL